MARKRGAGAATGYTILVVDDQEETLASVKLLLEREGHRVLLADSGARALEIFARNEVHLLLVDYFMPRMTGEELIGEVRKVDSSVQIVLQTGYSGEKPPRETLHQLDIQGYHDKTEGPDKLLVWVDVALKAHEQLRRVREAEILKSQLLANLSHEFRTPLHIVMGYTQLLKDEHVRDDAGRDVLDRVHDNAAMLLGLVNDFLALSDLDAGVAVPSAARIDVETLAREVQGSATMLLREKPISFAWEAPAELPALAADPAKVRVILMNLLSNAVKFTTAGSITVTAEADDETICLAIRDTGIGIAPENHERIFETFRQVDGSDTRAHGGMGNGLPIARKLARLMGGDITVDSVPGAGSTFSVRLPRDRRGAPAPSVVRRAAAAGA
jgi:signal transduction histidine kinase